MPYDGNLNDVDLSPLDSFDLSGSAAALNEGSSFTFYNFLYTIAVKRIAAKEALPSHQSISFRKEDNVYNSHYPLNVSYPPYQQDVSGVYLGRYPDASKVIYTSWSSVSLESYHNTVDYPLQYITKSNPISGSLCWNPDLVQATPCQPFAYSASQPIVDDKVPSLSYKILAFCSKGDETNFYMILLKVYSVGDGLSVRTHAVYRQKVACTTLGLNQNFINSHW